MKIWRILTEKLGGDEAGKLSIVNGGVSLKALKTEREKIITARLSKPLFNEKWTRQDLEKLFQIWELKVGAMA